MKKLIKSAILLLLPLAVSAQGMRMPPTKNLDSLSDDFSSPASINKWTLLHNTEEWVNKLKHYEVANGNLILEPRTSGWFEDQNAPFVYQTLTGDFDVRARVKSSGVEGKISSRQWSLGGLMVRIPKRGTSADWKPFQENWLFITTGVAEELNKPVIESKYTIRSKSSLKLREAKSDWVTLRIARVGYAFILMYKYDDDKTWTVQDRFYIQQWPETVQVGINCYTSSPNVTPQMVYQDVLKHNNRNYDDEGPLDMRLEVDYVTFKKPAISFTGAHPGETWLKNVSENRLTDYSLSNQELVKLLGE